MLILWTAVSLVLAVQTVWTYRGQGSPWFLWLEVGLGAASALLWGLLAMTTRTPRELYVCGLIWDLLYTAVVVGLPWIAFGVRMKPETWVCVAGAVLFMIAAKVTMEVTP